MPKPPTVAATANGAVLVYELHVINVSAQPWAVQKVDVLSATSGNPLLQSLAPEAIEILYRPPRDDFVRRRPARARRRRVGTDLLVGPS